MEKAKSLFGRNPDNWKFKCPCCGHVASVKDYEDAGAPTGAVGFSCIGRWSGHMDTDMGAGQPCNYSGGGLFQLNPVTVVFPDEEKHQVFEFAEEGNPNEPT